MEHASTKKRVGRLKGVYPDGKNIRELRLAKGWKQKELAKKAQLAPRTLERAEQGKSRVGLGILGNIARALGVDTEGIIVTDPAEEDLKVRVIPDHEQIRLAPTGSA